MQAVLAVTKMLREQQDLQQLVGWDQITGPWIIQEEMNGVKLLEGTGKASIVVHLRGSWAAANLDNTARFPLIGIEIWIDPDRDADTGALKNYARTVQRGNDIYQVVRQKMHLINGTNELGEGIFWGGVPVIACKAVDEPTFGRVSDGQGQIRGEALFNLTLA